MTPETPGPDRLEALLAGSAAARDAAERDLVALAADLAASEPRLPDGLDERIDAALTRPAAARSRRRPLAALRARPWLALAPAAALAAAVVGVVLAVRAGDSGAPPVVGPALERPAAAPSAATARPATAGVALRSGPGQRYAVVASLPPGARIRVACVVPGQRVVGPRTASGLWARVGPGRYAPVALLPAGAARGAGRCAPVRQPSGTP